MVFIDKLNSIYVVNLRLGYMFRFISLMIDPNVVQWLDVVDPLELLGEYKIFLLRLNADTVSLRNF